MIKLSLVTFILLGGCASHGQHSKVSNCRVTLECECDCESKKSTIKKIITEAADNTVILGGE